MASTDNIAAQGMARDPAGRFPDTLAFCRGLMENSMDAGSGRMHVVPRGAPGPAGAGGRAP